MARSLKDANRTPLVIAAIVNAALFYCVVQTDAIVAGNWLALLRGWMVAVPAGAAVVLVGVLNAQVDSKNKARLVFWRWKNPMPGSEAFTRHGARDERVNLKAIRKTVGTLPTLPEEQNKLWYRLYQTVAAHPSVEQVHREFLFARDFACMAAVLIVTLGPIGFVLIPSTKTAAIYLAVLIVEYLLATRAARVHGARFVTTVLALKGAGK